MQTGIYYDQVNGQQLRLIEYRRDGRCLYENEKGVRIVCVPEDVCQYPSLKMEQPVFSVKGVMTPEQFEAMQKESQKPGHILRQIGNILFKDIG